MIQKKGDRGIASTAIVAVRERQRRKLWQDDKEKAAVKAARLGKLTAHLWSLQVSVSRGLSVNEFEELSKEEIVYNKKEHVEQHLSVQNFSFIEKSCTSRIQ